MKRLAVEGILVFGQTLIVTLCVSTWTAQIFNVNMTATRPIGTTAHLFNIVDEMKLRQRMH